MNVLLPECRVGKGICRRRRILPPRRTDRGRKVCGLGGRETAGRGACRILKKDGFNQWIKQMAAICANPVINGTASYYIGQARAEGVEVSVDCAFDGTDKIQDVQLSGILGNLLENALEACRRMKGERRFIRLVLKSQGSGILVLVVENSYEGAVRTRGSRFLSSKRADLGLGLASVCDAVEQAGGTVEIHYDGSMFQVRVMLA